MLRVYLNAQHTGCASLLPHGLAELGFTEQEIMSITGHKTSKEIARYTKSANQKVRAEGLSIRCR